MGGKSLGTNQHTGLAVSLKRIFTCYILGVTSEKAFNGTSSS